ncbi:hypothetical protein GFS31_43050 (plasmid) [Leptolyngbya sp. BL0902]|uniref:relaxase/mobilization nuclease domain-containing protein n=1 Tax=Leptolyngbya sp. BL0902 TaxID=1115757 RepID=UPI0018E8EE70|nr:relaxase/mobilization nuclease domain-containing protein [Leptolyngbya sp. BL0902]QQE67592.1 hypothetical protein GFS31_43050 [Leptolyngbya sp. BL0902]
MRAATASDYLDKMGYTHLPYVVVRHTDTDHDHVHIVAGRFDLDKGKRVPGDWDHYKAEAAARELEVEYGLPLTVSSWYKERKPPTVGMIRHERDTGQPAVKPELQDLIDDVSNQVDSLNEFVDRLEEAGVELHVKPIGETTIGLTYHFKGLYFSASQLGRAYTLNGLRTFRGIASPQDSAAVMDWWEGRQRGQESESTEPELAQVQNEEHGQPESELEPEFPTPAQPASQNQEPTGVDPALKELEVQQRQAQEDEDQKRKAQQRRQRSRQMEL